mmetsp:Transcript_43533/g.110245  ORF Transcript_43533/g.110245 Transcript_43533/m.110245 type:complete len:207 (+) Transcript_43533:460-1080(+)
MSSSESPSLSDKAFVTRAALGWSWSLLLSAGLKMSSSENPSLSSKASVMRAALGWSMLKMIAALPGLARGDCPFGDCPFGIFDPTSLFFFIAVRVARAQAAATEAEDISSDMDTSYLCISPQNITADSMVFPAWLSVIPGTACMNSLFVMTVTCLSQSRPRVLNKSFLTLWNEMRTPFQFSQARRPIWKISSHSVSPFIRFALVSA